MQHFYRKKADRRMEKGENAVKKLRGKIAIVLLVILTFASLKLYTTKAMETHPQIWTPGCVSSVPRAWGQFRGGSAQSGLAFEDSAGTLRFLTNIPCDGTPTVALEIRRTAGNSPSGGNQ
jgi:hypothetical protein